MNILSCENQELKDGVQGSGLMNRNITIKARKFPDIDHYDWQGELVEQTPDYVAVLCKPGRKLIHHTKKKEIIMHNMSLEFFFLKEWFTVAMAFEEGKIVSYYCNVAMPSILEGDVLHFVDLDLDLVKRKNEDWKVVDEDEFEQNSVKYGYSGQLKQEAIQALERLKAKVIKADFPFHADVLQMVR